MFHNFIFVMLGGAIGAALRHGVGLLTSNVRLINMPVGTLIVNLLGCLLLGTLMGLTQRYTSIPKPLILMLTTGMCGAFTTFSTFTAETIGAMENGHFLSSMAYLIASIVFGLMLFWVGKFLALTCQ